MGIPGLMKFFLDKYTRETIILNKIDEKENEILYIDANCLFHPQCFKIIAMMEEDKTSPKESVLENKMFARIIQYIEYLIHYVKPKQVYIAVDGPAPLAKLSQQRKRRFKSVIYNEMKDELKKKHKIPPGSTNWTNTVITPGTEFMEKLHKILLKYCKDNNIIYSSYHENGEGEHKILQYMKKHPTQNAIIYGLDADLFMLSMASHQSNIYLLREASQISDTKTNPHIVEEELNFISINTIKECINNHIKEIIKGKNPKMKVTDYFCDDYIFICCFLGNDFLPHFPSIDIKRYGLEILLDSYTDMYIFFKKNLYKDGIIDNVFLRHLFENLADREKLYFEDILPNHLYKIARRRCYATTNYERELWEIDNMKFKFNDNVRLGVGKLEQYRKRYNNHYNLADMNNVCKNYLEGLKWVLQYYFDECPTWQWQYEHETAPFISDLFSFFKKYKCNMNKIQFTNEPPLKPLEQLLAVIPKQCDNLLPKSYIKITEIYPKNIELDLLNKDQFWQCEPILEPIDIKKIKELTKDCKLTNKEKQRN